MKKNAIIFSVSIIIITLLSAFDILYTSGCPYHSGSPADGLTCASCHYGGITTPTIIISSNPAFENGNKYLPGTTYTISVSGIGYTYYGFDLEILNSQSSISNSVLDFGTLTSISTSEIVNFPTPGYTYSDIMHTTPKSTPFNFTWTAPMSGTGYLYCTLLGVNYNGNTDGDKNATMSMTLNQSASNSLNEYSSLTKSLNVFIYPNPCKEKIVICYYLKNSKNIFIELFNAVGIKVSDIYQGEQEKGDHNLEYNLPSYLPKGNYLVKVMVDNQSTSKAITLN